jgi:hypothetical protein
MSAVGRANTAESLRRMAIVKPCKEAYELLTSLLADTETVTNRHAQAVSLTPYVHFRVCDYAYNSLSYILKESKELSVDMPPAFLHGSSLDTRDNTIAKFKAWWKDHSTSILNAKPTVAVDRSAWSKKLQSLVFK